MTTYDGAQYARLGLAELEFGSVSGDTYTRQSYVFGLNGNMTIASDVDNIWILTNKSSGNITMNATSGGGTFYMSGSSGYIASGNTQRIWWNSSGVGIYNGVNISSAYLPANSSLSSSYHIKVVNGIVMNA